MRRRSVLWATGGGAAIAIMLAIFLPSDEPGAEALDESTVALAPSRAPNRRGPTNSEPATDTASSTTESRLVEAVYLVHDAEDHPIAGASIVLFDGTIEVHRARSSEHGSASFPARNASVLALVSAEGFAGLAREDSLRAGEHRFRLGGGAVVSGRILVEGAPPNRPLRVGLATFGPLDKRFEKLRLLDADGRPQTVDLAYTTCDASGAFSFCGLAAHWSGAVVLPRGLGMRIVDSTRHEDRFPLHRPVTGFVIDTFGLPWLTGRVLGAIGAAPRTGVQVRLDWQTFDTKPHRARITRGVRTTVTDAWGRFELALDTSTFARAELTLSDPSTMLRMDVEPSTGGTDLGDLALSIKPPVATRTLRVAVLDSHRAPIANAAVTTWHIVARTDAAGECVLANVPAHAVNIEVAATGWEPVGLRCAEGGDARLEALLEPSTRLVVRVAAANGAPLLGRRVRIGELGAPPDARGVSLRDVLPRGTQPGSHSARWRGVYQDARRSFADGQRIYALSDAAGEIDLTQLVPGMALTAELLDGAGYPKATSDPFQLIAGETRHVELIEPPGRRGPLAGIVLDDRGHPQPGTMVTLSWRSEILGGEIADAAGRFEVAGVDVERVRLSAWRRGLEPLDLPDVALPPDGQHIEIILKHCESRDVTVIVRDSGGAPLSAALILPMSSSELPIRLPNGAYRFLDVPRFSMQLTVAIGGGNLKRELGPGEDSVVIDVPALATISAAFAGTVGDGFAARLMRVPRNGESGYFAFRELTPAERRARHCVWRDVWPGEYEMSLEVCDTTANRDAWTRQGDARMIAVAPGASVAVTLGH
jgi:hypothetical protein